jgi:enoyl-CoA hydratase/carnithine racemase
MSDPAPVESDAVHVSRPRPAVGLVTIASQPLGVLRISVKRALRQALGRLEADHSVGCVVMTGTGSAFSVGSDIREFQHDAAWLLHADTVESELNQAIEDSRLPVLAACNGHTLGGGAVLAMACDIRMAAESARFGFPEVKVGAFASGSGTQRLPQLVGRGRALELLLTGRVIDAGEAERLGLVQAVIPDAALLSRALDLAAEIAAMPAAAVAASKRCVIEGLRFGTGIGLARELALVVEVGLSADAIEGQRAFIEKRPARFSSERGGT